MTMKVGRTRQDVLEDGRHRTRAKVTFTDGTRRVLTFVTSPNIPFVKTNKGDLWLPTMLMVAKRRGEDLELTDPISERAASITRIQDILSTWYPQRMKRVEVHAPPAERNRRRLGSPKRITGTFFTGGVDSFYTLTKNADRIGAIVYGFGIDVPLREIEAVERTNALLEDVAAESGVRLLTARTTIRKFLQPDTRWGSEAHGAALASLATLFSPIVDRILVPASHTYSNAPKWGSHPMLDGLWSTDRLAVEHDGSEAGRPWKAQVIADNPVAQRNLRVCYMKFADMNCCRCLKCQRTMAGLAAIDRLDDFPTFHEPLDLELMAAYVMRRRGNDVTNVRNLYDFVRRQPGHDDIKKILWDLLEKPTV
ncbi:hypothetical protein J2X11_002110 [Aeromicrobium panaciterrae]|uniref:7-cyano-7-deazaguanine synthase n=1 Tax=Aeromicrobium panaciterrae TaxID=363861 RepID=A0ABU1UQ23_9ACTN|nr:hypothetical protein [Aeromicrobium panaciterrae]MDR7087271.1 hypothetical protein [Aeromicrobium panaciterrae]